MKFPRPSRDCAPGPSRAVVAPSSRPPAAACPAPLAVLALATLLAASAAWAQKKGDAGAAEVAAPPSFYEVLGVPPVAEATCAVLGNLNAERVQQKVPGLDDSSQRILGSTFDVFAKAEKIGDRIKGHQDEIQEIQHRIAEAGEEIEALGASPKPSAPERRAQLQGKVAAWTSQIADLEARIPPLEAEILNILPRAVPLLEKALASPRLSGGGRALAWNYLAFVHGETEQFGKARAAYENLIAEPEATPAQRRPAHYTAGQIAMADEDFAAGLEHLKRWFALSRELGRQLRPDNYYLLAQGHYQNKDAGKSLEVGRQTLDLAQCLDVQPREGWLKLVAGLLAQEERLDESLLPTQMLVLLYPKREYWTQLHQIYTAREDFAARTTALHLAYRLDLLEKEREYVGLAQALVEQGIPVEAAQILREGIDREIVAANGSHLSQLGGMYHRAGDVAGAVRYYRLAADAYREEKEKDKQVNYLRYAAQLLVREADFEESLKLVDQALGLKPKDRDRAELLNLKARILDELARPEDALEMLLAAEEQELPDEKSRADLIKRFQRQLANRDAYDRFMEGIQKATDELRRDIAARRR